MEQFSRKVVGGSRVAGAIRSLVNARDLWHKCARVLHETFLVPVLIYASETMLWKEKERSSIRAVQIYNLKVLPGIRSPKCMDKKVMLTDEGVDERIDEGLLWWFIHVERMERDRITKIGYVREWAGSRSLGRPQKRRNDVVKDCLKKEGLDVREAR